ncbi:MAG: outer membrane lipoprotein chaperone LolA [Pseudomonadota bacterium]
MFALVCRLLVLWSVVFYSQQIAVAADAPAPLATPLDSLSERLSGFDQITGEFQQQLFSEDGALLQESEGRYALLRPGYLRWHIATPEEQILVAAGDSLWHYDVELETANERPIASGDPTNPLTIVGGEPQALAEFYTVSQDDADHFTLRPRFADAEFSQVDLLFDGQLPATLEVEDQLGRRTLIRFVTSDVDTSLKPEDFTFTPPEGVDVYQHDR